MFSVTVGLAWRGGRTPGGNFVRTSAAIPAPALIEHIVTTLCDLLLNCDAPRTGVVRDVVVSIHLVPGIFTSSLNALLTDALVHACQQELLGRGARQVLDDLPLQILPEELHAPPSSVQGLAGQEVEDKAEGGGDRG